MVAGGRVRGTWTARWLTRAVCSIAVVAVVGCGGRAQRVEGSESGSGGAPGSDETGGGAGVDGDEVVLVLPVVPREEAGLPLILEEVGVAENAGRCELTVTGADLNGGLGLSAGLEVELVPLEPTGD